MTLNLTKFCKEKDLEVCGTERHLQYHKICIMAIYRAPSGDFQYFLNTVEEILNSFHNKFNDIILCGDININSTFKQSMEIMVSFFALSDIITLPTRIHKESQTIIDSIFINIDKLNNYSIFPVINGLSDHDAQSLIIHDLLNYKPRSTFHYFRKLN